MALEVVSEVLQEVRRLPLFQNATLVSEGPSGVPEVPSGVQGVLVSFELQCPEMSIQGFFRGGSNGPCLGFNAAREGREGVKVRKGGFETTSRLSDHKTGRSECRGEVFLNTSPGSIERAAVVLDDPGGLAIGSVVVGELRSDLVLCEWSFEVS